MGSLINGLHHITALANDPQDNINFYSGILGMRFIKKTINFDAPDVYHLYYGDDIGNPGTVLTFFPYNGIPRGRKGKGQMTVTSLSIPQGSLGYWMERLQRFNIPFTEPRNRFDETYIAFEDFDSLGLELVENAHDIRPGFTYGHIPIQHSVRGYYGVTLEEDASERTSRLLTETMEHTLVQTVGNRFRYVATDKPGHFVDIIQQSDGTRGLQGSGTIHHLAFGTDDDTTQLNIRTKVLDHGLDITPVIDRQYFHSVYFREPGGILFEIATLPPGFTVDEPKETLGGELKLPVWAETHRSQIEQGLQPIALDIEQFR